MNDINLKNDRKLAVIKTNLGEITIVLYCDLVKKTTENFITHAKNGYYDGVIFHRVIDNFMIQGGDPTGTGRGGESIWGEPFEDECTPLLRNYRGALSMANAGENTNGSQFFIVQAKPNDKDMSIEMLEQVNKKYKIGLTDKEIESYSKEGGTPWLDGKHTVFGQVTEGMDILDKIASVEVDSYSNKPLEDVIIEKITIK